MKQSLLDSDDNNNQSSIDLIVKSRYKQLIEQGSCEVGVDLNINPDYPPVWFDRQRFQRSQQTAQKYHFSVKFASFSGLLFGIQVPIFLEPLLATGNHESVSKLFKRYLDTDIKISSWYQSDPFDPTSDAYKSLRVVRSMHQSVSKLMNSSTNRKPGQDRLWVSQFQMVMTQVGFFGLLISHSSSCGAHGITDTELEDIIYLWRVLGYLNGIQDKYNSCTGNLKETQAYMVHILKHFLQPQIVHLPTHPYPIGEQVAQGIAEAFRPVQPTVRYQVIRTYWFQITGIPIAPDHELTWYHKLLLLAMKFTFNWLLRFKFIYNHFNEKSKQRFIKAIKNCSAIEKQLTNQYSETFNYGSCPFSVTLDSLTTDKVQPRLNGGIQTLD